MIPTTRQDARCPECVLVVACIPAFNEERTIAKVVMKARRHANVVLVCDDGSSDMTGEIAENLGAVVLKHEGNSGYGSALRTLFTEARRHNPDIVVTLDADDQHDPDEIPRLVEPIAKGETDIVIGSRFLGRSNAPNYRRFGVGMITRISNMSTKLDVTDAQSGFRAYSGRALESAIPTEMDMGASVEILEKASRAGLRVKEVPVYIRYDVAKPSSQNPLTHGIGVVMSVIKLMAIRHPLMFFGLPGAISFGTGMVFLLWTLDIFARTREIVTNIALAAIGATTVGLILLTAGIMLYVVVTVVREVK